MNNNRMINNMAFLILALETCHRLVHDWPPDRSLRVTRVPLPQSSPSSLPSVLSFTLSAFGVSGSFQEQLDPPSLSPFLDAGSL